MCAAYATPPPEEDDKKELIQTVKQTKIPKHKVLLFLLID